jgi:hypothetical protein
MLSTEQLLMPRYKVIADYPMSSHAVGDVLTYLIGGTFVNERIRVKEDSLQNYPAIFKPLSWWEERALEDMPEYVKSGQGNSVRKVKGYELHWNKIILDGGKVRSISQWFPATLTEYQSFINGNSNK